MNKTHKINHKAALEARPSSNPDLSPEHNPHEHEYLGGIVHINHDALKKVISEQDNQIQGWFLISAAVVLLIYVFIGLRFINDVLIGLALILFTYGALKVHLLHQIKSAVHWLKKRLSKAQHHTHAR